MHHAESWLEAARSAAFPIYALSEPPPVHIRGVGHGGLPGEPPHSVDVVSELAGTDVTVKTFLRRRQPSQAVLTRLLVHDLVSTALPVTDEPIQLPLHLTVEAQDRVIAVDGRPVTFRGVALNGAWGAVAELSDEIALRVVARTAVPTEAITALEDLTLVE